MVTPFFTISLFCKKKNLLKKRSENFIYFDFRCFLPFCCGNVCVCSKCRAKAFKWCQGRARLTTTLNQLRSSQSKETIRCDFTTQENGLKIPPDRGGARHLHLGGPLEGPVLQQGELSMVCVGLLERDLKNFGGARQNFGGSGPPGIPLAPTCHRMKSW